MYFTHATHAAQVCMLILWTSHISLRLCGFYLDHNSNIWNCWSSWIKLDQGQNCFNSNCQALGSHRSPHLSEPDRELCWYPAIDIFSIPFHISFHISSHILFPHSFPIYLYLCSAGWIQAAEDGKVKIAELRLESPGSCRCVKVEAIPWSLKKLWAAPAANAPSPGPHPHGKKVEKLNSERCEVELRSCLQVWKMWRGISSW